jgi:hypothetical protein
VDHVYGYSGPFYGGLIELYVTKIVT